MTPEKMQAIIEAALMVAGKPLTTTAIQNLFAEDERPSSSDIKAIISAIKDRHSDGGIELHEVASGYRFQARAEYSEWLAKLWEERAARYSRAFMETLAIIAYKQPVTRAEIEEIRGVTVSTNIMKTLLEREWVRVVGHRDIPGKPAIYGTTKLFLDYFNLKSLSDLPSLAEFKTLEAQEDELQVQLAIENSGIGPDNSEVIPEERDAIMAEEDSSETETIESNDETQPEEITTEAKRMTDASEDGETNTEDGELDNTINELEAEDEAVSA